MAKLTIDENGEAVDFLAERNKEITESLRPKAEILLEERAADRFGKKRLGFRMMMQINGELNKYPRMSGNQFANLDADEIDYYWQSYYDLMCYYNLYFEIVPNRQSFLRYMGINNRQYFMLLESDDNDIKAEMNYIEDALKQDGFLAGESGNADAKAIATRLSAKTDGHSMVSAGEEMLTQAVEKKNSTELWRDLEKIVGGDLQNRYLK